MAESALAGSQFLRRAKWAVLIDTAASSRGQVSRRIAIKTILLDILLRGGELAHAVIAPKCARRSKSRLDRTTKVTFTSTYARRHELCIGKESSYNTRLHRAAQPHIDTLRSDPRCARLLLVREGGKPARPPSVKFTCEALFEFPSPT